MVLVVRCFLEIRWKCGDNNDNFNEYGTVCYSHNGVDLVRLLFIMKMKQNRTPNQILENGDERKTSNASRQWMICLTAWSRSERRTRRQRHIKEKVSEYHETTIPPVIILIEKTVVRSFSANPWIFFVSASFRFVPTVFPNFLPSWCSILSLSLAAEIQK